MKHTTLPKKIFVTALLACSSNIFAQTSPLNIGTIPVGKSIIIVYDVTVNAGATSISNQASISGTNFSTFSSNDPKTVAAGDATVTIVLTTYYPKITATDLSQTTDWTTDINGSAGSSPADFLSPNQLFNVNRVANVLSSWMIAGGSNLLLSTTSGLTFGPLSRFTIGTGSTADFTDKPVTFRSTAAGTASLAAIAGTLSNATNVTVERFMAANTTGGRSGRAWRLLAAPLKAASAPTIRNSWQGGGIASAFGTYITQAGGMGTNGFDVSSIATSSSIRSFDGTNLVTPANTNVVKVTDNGAAYFLFVRGNRNIDINNITATSDATLRMTGAIDTGAVNGMGKAGTAFSLIPNPYPSSVDYELIKAANATLTNFYYIWDANLGINGAYRTVERVNTTTYQQTPSIPVGSPAVGDNTARYIRSGQAFFVPVNTTVNFTESMKTDQLPVINVYRTGSAEEMTVDLKVVNASGGYLADGVRVKFDNSYSNTVDASDVRKLDNFSENLGLARHGSVLAIEKRDLVDQADTIFLKLWNTGVKDYQFEITPTLFNAPSLSAYLEDTYLGTSTAISLSNPTQVQFSVTSDAASQNIARFRIVFRTSGTLAVNYTSVKAYEKNTGVQVEWNLATESNMSTYEVERSADGRNFTKAGAVTARYNNNASASYSWFDAAPLSGSNFYRIRAIETSGAGKYSQVVKVTIGKGKSDIVVNPNPVTDNLLNLQLQNQPKGTYNVRMFNNLGQQVYAAKVEHPGGSSAQTLQLSSSIARGIYQLQVTSGETTITRKIVFD